MTERHARHYKTVGVKVRVSVRIRTSTRRDIAGGTTAASVAGEYCSGGTSSAKNSTTGAGNSAR